MLKSLSKNLTTPLRGIAGAQQLLPGIVVLIALFLIFGTLSQPAASEKAAFGLAAQSFLVLSFLAFVGGIVSFASPCTLPILPAYFAFATQSGRKRIALNTIAFMLGIATMFSLLGASASALGRVLLQNQQLLLLFGGTIVMGFGVMSLLGKGFAGLSSESGTSPSTTARGSFVFGLTFSVGWSSCVGPILGVVLTLAASTGSVLRGMMLLFIYALGLGLPLVIASTFFGRTSRKSIFWRLLKGIGWRWDTHSFVIGLVWAFAAWRVLAAFGRYLFRNLDYFAGQNFSLGHEAGLLLLAVATAALWIFTSPDERRITLQLHSTQTLSGVLFILMAVLMLNGTLSTFNSLIPPDLAIWFAGFEEQLISFFT